MRLSLIIPVLNEAVHLSQNGDLLRSMKPDVHDLIIVDGDPLQDIAVLRNKINITAVLKGGKTVPRLPL